MATVARGLPDGGFYLEGVLDIPHHFDRFLISSSMRERKAAGSSGRAGGAACRGGRSCGGDLGDASLGAVEVSLRRVSGGALQGTEGQRGGQSLWESCPWS